MKSKIKPVISLITLVLLELFMQTPAFSQEAIYSMNNLELHIAQQLFKNSMASSLIQETEVSEGEKFYKVSATEYALSFQRDLQGAIDKYSGAKLMVTGKLVQKGKSSEMSSYGDFLTPKGTALHIIMAPGEMVSKSISGQEHTLYCKSGGSIGKTAVLIDCYMRDRIEREYISTRMTQLQEFMQGATPASTEVSQAALMSIVVTELLPDTSSCFNLESTDHHACIAEVHNLDEQIIKPKLHHLAKSLRARGLKV